MSLDTNDLEAIERLVARNGDDLAVSIARSFERMEDRIDTIEVRIDSKLDDLEDTVRTTA